MNYENLSSIAFQHMSFYVYGVTTGLILSSGLFALFFAIKKYFFDRCKHNSLTFLYGAVAFFSYALFNTYSLSIHSPIAHHVFSENFLIFCKLSIPIGLYMNFRMLAHSIPIKSVDTFVFWQNSKKYQYVVHCLYFISFVALIFIHDVNIVIALGFAIAMIHCIFGIIVTKYSVKSQEMIILYVTILTCLMICFLSIIAMVLLYDLEQLPDLLFFVIHAVVSVLIILCSFSLISYTIEVDSVKSANIFSIDSFEKNVFRAIKNKELFVVYQPKLDLSSHKVTSLEALVRWQHLKRGLIYPDDFIPIAEQTYIINEICKYVVDVSIKDLKYLRSKSIDVSMSVNFSVKDIQKNMAEYLVNKLHENDINPNLFIIEITESLFLQVSEEQKAALIFLRAAGVKLSLDDFGAGFSSLRHIDELELDEVKLDRSITGKLTGSDKATVVGNIINLCHDLNISVVAEGIENSVMAESLKQMGCKQAQGFCISVPLTRDDLIEWYQNLEKGIFHKEF